MSDVFRIGKVVENGHAVLVLEVFGVTAATTHDEGKVAAYEENPSGFTEDWGGYFMQELLILLLEDMQNKGRFRGWLLAHPLNGPAPKLPREGD
ncbi:hypothetical protein SEA_SATIS_250 [Streptomyces phage Satis]|nr:hypothetical protein SEA_SATIS_250 [Streptomyces phage Satis]QBZ72137.1 hypothetical protein SEA_KRADAL_251 [Streptomyces phage Kradal]QPL14558.1 hypothetical protein SEA_EHYELIMAYOE_253 [Streptomyces phage EhyElimayoE]